MAASNTSLYKKQKRREGRSKIREAIFVNEYVETKYLHIYEEAAELYNNLNEIYPCKPDLRRTDEFRFWKNDIARERSMPFIRMPRQKRRQFVHTPHRNIPLSQRVVNLVVQPHVENENSVPESPRAETESSPPTTESPRTEPIRQKVMQLRIPLLASASRENPLQTPVETIEAPVESVETPDETLETVTDEVIQESCDILHPSLIDEVSPEIVDKIIAELREDPELTDVMAGIEQQIEVEEVGLDIDIPDLCDPFEDELENILW